MQVLSLILFSLLPFIFLAVFAYVAYAVFRSFRQQNEEETIDASRMFFPAVVISIVALNLFAYNVYSGVGLGLFLASLIGCVFLSFKKGQHTHVALAVTVVGVLASVLLGYRANEFVQAINLITSLGCLLTLIVLRSLQTVRWQSGWIFFAIGAYALRALRHIPLLLRTLLSLRTTKHPKMITTVRTALITVAVLLFFTMILAAADPIFKHIVETVLDEIVPRALLSVFLATAFAIATTFTLSLGAPKRHPLQAVSYYEVVVPVCALITLFVVFLSIQFRYLFGTHIDFYGLDITYSDYVRKGFVELLLATFFGGIISYLITLKHKQPMLQVQQRILQGINIVLILELFLLLGSALKRDLMYIETYGLTRVRIIGGVWLVWLAVILVILLLFTLIKRMREGHLLAGTGVLSAVVVIALNVMNVDRQIATAVPPRDQPKDFFYISALSADAYVGWEEVVRSAHFVYEDLRKKDTISDADKTRLADAKLAILLLQQERSRLQERFDGVADTEWSEAEPYKWQNYVYSKYQAYRNMQTNRSLFYDTVDCLEREIRDYQVENGVELETQERERLYEFTYPFLDVSISGYYPQSVEYMSDAWSHSAEKGYNDVAETCYRKT